LGYTHAAELVAKSSVIKQRDRLTFILNFMNNNNNPTVAFFIPSMSDGGAERVTLNLVNNIASRHKLNVHLVLVHATGPFLSQVASNVKIIDLKSKHTKNSLFKLAKYLSEHKPIAVVTALQQANVVALIANQLAWRFTTRIIATLHINLSASKKNPTNNKARLLPFLIKHTYRWADQIVAVSNGVADDFSENIGVSRSSIKVIYNPVITSDVVQKATEQPDHRWFGGDSPPVVLAAGRLGEQKNFGLLIEAFNIIKDLTNANLLILGEGEQRESLQKKINECQLQSRVELHGFVSNPYSYMSKAKVFAMSSIFEGLPTVLIEALYCGANLVSTDCPSGPREILQDGKLGGLVEVDNAQQLSKALLDAIQDSNEKNVTNNAWHQFRVNEVADSYVRTIRG